MTRRNKNSKSNSRARAKHIKCVRVRSLYTHSAYGPNASESEIVSVCRSTFDNSLQTLVPLKAAKAPTKSECSQKASRRSQSVEVLQNAPIIERAFCRFSSESAACPCCHMNEECTIEDIVRWNDMVYTPCDIVRECIDCRFFHV